MRWAKFLAVFALMVLLLSVGPGVARADNPLPSNAQIAGTEALEKDAKMYVATMGVSLDEAIRRLSLQDAIGDLNARLTANEGATFAGLLVEHKPVYRVVVRFIRNGEATIQPYIAGGPLAGMVDVRTANVTLKDLETARDQAAQIAGKLGIEARSAINVAEGRAELFVLDPLQLDAALQKAATRLPEGVKVIQVSSMPKEVSDIYGGLALRTCTSGFSVKASNGTKGITTAGHCDNSQSYQGVNLPFVAEMWQSWWDIQWHTAPGFTVRNLIFDGTYNRYIFSVAFRSSQYPGEWVCKYGVTTGYGCGTIVTTSFDGYNVEVNISVNFGDSGGPWFWNNSAFGTTISMYGNYSIYGPPEQIYNGLGLSILTN